MGLRNGEEGTGEGTWDEGGGRGGNGKVHLSLHQSLKIQKIVGSGWTYLQSACMGTWQSMSKYLGEKV